jgi:hypothetical protein
MVIRLSRNQESGVRCEFEKPIFAYKIVFLKTSGKASSKPPGKAASSGQRVYRKLAAYSTPRPFLGYAKVKN